MNSTLYRMPISSESKHAIFSLLKKVMKEGCPPLIEKEDKKDIYQIIGNKPIPYGSKKTIIEGMFFSTAMVRKDNVSFYFFCNYTDPEELKEVAPTVLKCLKGKSCFHFKKEEQVPEEELRAMIRKGIDIYKKKDG